MIKNFRHACVVVKDIDRSLRFYRDMLGFKVFKIISLHGKSLEAIFNRKGIKLAYVKLRSPAQPKNSPAVFELHCWERPRILPRPAYNHVSFTVKDIEGEYARLTKLGVKFISGPVRAPHGDTKLCFGYDPDGNLIEFVEDLKR